MALVAAADTHQAGAITHPALHALARSDPKIQDVFDDRISGRLASARAIARGLVSTFGPQLEVLGRSSDSGVAALVTTVRQVAVEASELSTGDLRELRTGARAATALAQRCGIVLDETPIARSE